MGIADVLGRGPRVVQARLPRRGQEESARQWEELEAYRAALEPLGAWTKTMAEQFEALTSRAEAGELFDVVEVRGLPPRQLEAITARHVTSKGEHDFTAMLPDLMAASAVDPGWADAAAWRQAIEAGDIDQGAIATLRKALDAANLNVGGMRPLGGSPTTSSSAPD